MIGHAQARQDLGGNFVVNPPNLIYDMFYVNQFKQRIGQAMLGGLRIGPFVFLDSGTVAEHHTGDVAGGVRGVNISLKALSYKPWESANVIVVSVR